MFRGLLQGVSDAGGSGRAAQDAPDGTADGKSGDAVQNPILISGARPTLKLRGRLLCGLGRQSKGKGSGRVSEEIMHSKQKFQCRPQCRRL
jgi:hypothetical protein